MPALTQTANSQITLVEKRERHRTSRCDSQKVSMSLFQLRSAPGYVSEQATLAAEGLGPGAAQGTYES